MNAVNEHAKKRDLQQTAFNCALSLSIWAGIVYLQNQRPLVFMYLVAEDWWGEYATFVAYITAFGLLVAGMKVANRLRTPGHFCMAFGLFCIGMEEISWGQRLFGVRTPHIVTQLNYQSEINFHNAVNVDFTVLFCYALIIWMFIFPVLAARSRKIASWLAALGVPRVSWPQMPLFVLALVILLGALVNSEAGELILGLAFVSWAAETYQNARAESGRRSISPLVYGCCLVLLMTGITALLVAIGSDTRSYQRRLRHSAIIAYPSHGLNDQAAILFRHMIDQPHIDIYNDALFEYGRFLQRIRSADAERVLQRFLQERYHSSEDDQTMPEDHRRAGVVFRLLNDEESARRAFQRALETDTHRIQRARTDADRSRALFSLAMTYFEMRNVSPALKHARDARELAQTRRDRLRITEWIENVERGHTP